jgi:integrase
MRRSFATADAAHVVGEFSEGITEALALAAGVIAKDDHSRFGWHNLRHSLATFFGSNEVHPSVIQTMLRHTKQQTTARYIHAVNAKQIEAQGKYLDAIKIVARNPERAA